MRMSKQQQGSNRISFSAKIERVSRQLREEELGGGEVGGRRPAEMLLRALMSTPLETRMRKMVRSPCATAGVRGK